MTQKTASMKILHTNTFNAPDFTNPSFIKPDTLTAAQIDAYYTLTFNHDGEAIVLTQLEDQPHLAVNENVYKRSLAKRLWRVFTTGEWVGEQITGRDLSCAAFDKDTLIEHKDDLDLIVFKKRTDAIYSVNHLNGWLEDTFYNEAGNNITRLELSVTPLKNIIEKPLT